MYTLFLSYSSWEKTLTTTTPRLSITPSMGMTSSSVWRTCGMPGRALKVRPGYFFVCFISATAQMVFSFSWVWAFMRAWRFIGTKSSAASKANKVVQWRQGIPRNSHHDPLSHVRLCSLLCLHLCRSLRGVIGSRVVTQTARNKKLSGAQLKVQQKSTAAATTAAVRPQGVSLKVHPFSTTTYTTLGVTGGWGRFYQRASFGLSAAPELKSNCP